MIQMSSKLFFQTNCPALLRPIHTTYVTQRKVYTTQRSNIHISFFWGECNASPSRNATQGLETVSTFPDIRKEMANQEPRLKYRGAGTSHVVKVQSPSGFCACLYMNQGWPNSAPRQGWPNSAPRQGWPNSAPRVACGPQRVFLAGYNYAWLT